MQTAVEQGDVGLYDPDANLLMEVLNSGEELSDAGFVVGPEDNGRKSISKDGKVLFVSKIESNQLKEGQLNVKFTKDKKTNKYVPSEYYVGKFKNNLFEDENGKHTFAERYNTGIQERYDGGFSEGTQDVNNKNAYYGQEKVNNIVEKREKDRSNFLLDNDKEYEREPQDNINGNK